MVLISDFGTIIYSGIAVKYVRCSELFSTIFVNVSKDG